MSAYNVPPMWNPMMFNFDYMQGKGAMGGKGKGLKGGGKAGGGKKGKGNRGGKAIWDGKGHPKAILQYPASAAAQKST